MNSLSPVPFLTISLDFELFWGVRDKRTLADYGANILGVRQAIPAMLALFRQYDVSATWATVGMLACRTRKELERHVPDVLPAYRDVRLSPYPVLAQLGVDESADPYHFGYSLLRQIEQTPGMEIGTHTFSHFYCLEPGATPQAFRADMQASNAVFSSLGLAPRSLVFPRNQYDRTSIAIAAEAGITSYRGNPEHAFYATAAQSEEGRLKRAGRLADAYLNLSGHHTVLAQYEDGRISNVAASRFLRPWSSRLSMLESLRVARICGSMTAAAQAGRGFHLWWHPHNFGANLPHNIAALTQVLAHFSALRERYGMRSRTMADLASAALL